MGQGMSLAGPVTTLNNTTGEGFPAKDNTEVSEKVGRWHWGA